MARYTGAVCRLCRREGTKLFLKGERCYTGKCALGTVASMLPVSMARAERSFPSTACSYVRSRRLARYYGILGKPVPQIFRNG